MDLIFVKRVFDSNKEILKNVIISSLNEGLFLILMIYFMFKNHRKKFSMQTPNKT